MKQIVQHLKDGSIELLEVPIPTVTRGKILIKTRYSLISVGTERMLVEFGRSGWFAKAQQQPEKLRQVFDKIKTDGLLTTIEAVRAKLDEPMPLGYCNVGEVVAVAEDVTGWQIGDRVVSNGAHAEYVIVPQNLCAHIPDSVSDEAAAFTVLGAIGLQGIRLAQPTLGEIFVVTGLGLIGLLTVQILLANGCRVIGIDINSQRVALARQFGAYAIDIGKEDPVATTLALTNGKGVDGVLITAATKSNEPIRQAAQMARKRGRIVLIGVAGLELNRADFYEKELSFQVSCSYGPGRYDENYEQKGHDYPFGYVRWTEQRNFEAILTLMASKKLEVQPLISHVYPFQQAQAAYATIMQKGDVLGVILKYEQKSISESSQIHLCQATAKSAAEINVGVIGVGNYAKLMLLPALKKTGVNLQSVADLVPLSASYAARKFAFHTATSDYHTILKDESINTVFITTRHDLHARLVCEFLAAGKNVFVEKPLALNQEELKLIEGVYQQATTRLLVGFNRRFAPQVAKMKELLYNRNEPLCVNILVNAGYIPPEHWVHDPMVGGGRIIGEACHFVDLITFLTGSSVIAVSAFGIIGDRLQDKVIINLQLADGSIGSIQYLANGNKSYPKELVQVFSSGRILELINFRQLVGYGWKSFRKFNLWKQDKGHQAEIATFIAAIRHGVPSPIPFEELRNTTIATLAIMEALQSKKTVELE